MKFPSMTFPLGVAGSMLLTILTATPGLSFPFFPASQNSSDWEGGSRAERVCVNALESRGFRVTDVLERNDFTGGSEIILRVRERNSSYAIGCDYADRTGEVQLYQLQGYGNRYDDDYDDDRYDDYDDDDSYNRGGRVGNRREAETIARRAIEDQLGVDANSEVIEIDEAERNNRRWKVTGNVNGAPFEIKIRSEDGSVEDFELR